MTQNIMSTYLKPSVAENSYRLQGSERVRVFEMGILDILSGCRRNPLPQRGKTVHVCWSNELFQEVTGDRPWASSSNSKSLECQ